MQTTTSNKTAKRIRHTLNSAKLAEWAHTWLKPGEWHGYAKDSRTRKAVERAALLGRIVVSPDTHQFRLP